MVTEIPWNDGTSDKIYLTYTAASGDQTILVSSDANAGPARTKDITFVSSIGNIARVLTVMQETNMSYVSITWNDTCITYNDTAIAYPYEEEYIVFADPLVEQICATNWGDGTGITPSQALLVTSIGTQFNAQAITSFDELATYFTNVTTIGSMAFQGCTSLQSTRIPASVTSIGGSAFSGCTALKDLDILSTSTFNVTNFIPTNGSFGNNTGKFHLAGSISTTTNSTFSFLFKEIAIDGSVSSTSTARYVLQNTSLEVFRIGGNVTIGYPLNGSTGLKFFELGGTTNARPIGNSTGLVVHLKYNGVACAPTSLASSNFDSRISKVYVDSQAVLNQYLADSNWSAYSSKLDLWENYNGEYKD